MLILYYSFLTAYWAFIIYTTTGWSRLKREVKAQKDPTTFVSIIVPFRNEENNLKSLIDSISIQKYPKNLFELILVNDHSDDGSLHLLNSIKAQVSFNIAVISLPEGSKFKKAAISLGVKNAKGELILTSDCDTNRSATWISSIVSFYEENKPDMIIAPVLMEDGPSFFKKFQALEFLSLQWVTATYAGQNNAILCNGANLIFTKSVFQELSGYEETPEVVSGDDFFFMLKLKKSKTKKISYILDKEALVTTKAEEKWNSFSQQRLRWAAKSKYAGENSFFLTGIYNTLVSIGMIILPFVEYDKPTFPIYTLIFLTMKFFGDWYMLKKIAHFFELKIAFTTFLPSFVLYPFYICHTFIQSLVMKPKWKGRSI